MAEQPSSKKRPTFKSHPTKRAWGRNSSLGGGEGARLSTTAIPPARMVSSAVEAEGLVTRDALFGLPPDHAAKLEAIREKNHDLSQHIRRRSFAAAIKISEWTK
jgi:hypothetical protein